MKRSAMQEARRRYYAEWRARNRDKVREYNRRYWERRAERESRAENDETASKGE